MEAHDIFHVMAQDMPIVPQKHIHNWFHQHYRDNKFHLFLFRTTTTTSRFVVTISLYYIDIDSFHLDTLSKWMVSANYH